MTQDLFGTFDQDLQRLLLAGSGATGGDEGLLRAQDAFGKLAAKVPVLAAAQAQIGKVLEARGRAAATELLNLGVMNLRIRGAQARPAAGEGLEPLPPAAPLETSTPQHDLEAIHRALTSGVSFSGKKIQRYKVVEEAVERGTFRDLRLLDLWVKALTDPALGDRVAERILPALGEAAAARIERQFNPRGKVADARRLRCLVAIRGEAARPLVEACLQAPESPLPLAPVVASARGKKTARKKTEQDTSVEVRIAAVEALERVAPAEAEERACALYRTETQREVRAACVQVMGAGNRLTTLEFLLVALRDSSQVIPFAVKALQRFRHPKTTERLLAILTSETLDIKAPKTHRSRVGKKPTKTSQAERKSLQDIQERTDFVCKVIHALSLRPSPEVLDRLIELFRNHPSPAIREAAGEALKASGEHRALEVLAERLDNEDPGIDLAVWAFFKLDLNSVFERMQPYLTKQALSTDKGIALARRLLCEVGGVGYVLDEEDPDVEKDQGAQDENPLLDSSNDQDPEQFKYRNRRKNRYSFQNDPRWLDVSLRILEQTSWNMENRIHRDLIGDVVTILGNLRAPGVLDILLNLLRRNVCANSVAEAIFHIGDRSVIPGILALLRLQKPRIHAIQLLGSFKAKEAVDPLCALLANESIPANPIVEALGHIGEPRAAPIIAASLLRKDILSCPYQALHALRQLDNSQVIPSIQEALKKAKKSKKPWIITRYEELITYLERDRKV